MTLNNPFDFTGKTVVLAGATGGLDADVDRLRGGGAHLAGCARSGPALDKLAAESAPRDGADGTDKVDLCDEKQVEASWTSARKRFGRIDVLVTFVGDIIRSVGRLSARRVAADHGRQSQGVLG